MQACERLIVIHPQSKSFDGLAKKTGFSVAKSNPVWRYQGYHFNGELDDHVFDTLVVEEFV